ncbi:MAG TPA: hypothetical protein VD907_03795 [Verrucomicrobiae bacterium]|nr:hypothetical protein [Verrucomicrobiae bacterium]
MADPNNPGQFGNRDDTEEQARQGGLDSTGSFGEENGADPQQAGQKGGENSQGGGRPSNDDEEDED